MDPRIHRWGIWGTETSGVPLRQPPRSCDEDSQGRCRVNALDLTETLAAFGAFVAESYNHCSAYKAASSGAADIIRSNYSFSKMPPRSREERSEFYCSLIVLTVVSIWTYVLSVYINSAPEKSEKKEQ